tara:strand:+ start:260 stop:634 length:375 start_codon:yes stop_codon:yes gene_type:complete
MDLFQKVDFISHAGIPMSWKIECDAITMPQWECLAKMIMEYQTEPFRAAIGIPRGGSPLGFCLNAYATDDPAHPFLIADDVYTTGTSFREFLEQEGHAKEDVYCWTVFARKPTTDGVRALFTMP